MHGNDTSAANHHQMSSLRLTMKMTMAILSPEICVIARKLFKVRERTKVLEIRPPHASRETGRTGRTSVHAVT